MDYHNNTLEPLTYAIGDIPENAKRLREIGSALYDAMHEAAEENIPFPHAERDEIDSYIDVEILPIGDGERPEYGKGIKRPENEVHKNLELLYDLRDMWGNGSEVVAWRFKSKDMPRPEHKKREEDYRAVLLKNEAGEVVAFVSDTREERNALYLWRADVSEAASHFEVLGEWKRDVRKEHINARRFMHREGRDGLDNRVYRALTLDAGAYRKQLARERKYAAKKREARVRKLGEVGLSAEE